MNFFVHALRVSALAGLVVFALASLDAAPAQASDVTILYNGAVRGELDDCGCPKRPLGGLARRALVLEQLETEHPDAIRLDPGSLFGDPTADTLEKSRFLAQETAALGYDAIGIGPYELGHGVDTVRQIASSTGLRFVSANVARGGDLLFEPYRVIERGGVKVAVTSVFDPEFVGAEYMARAGEIDVNDPVEAMKTWLPEMDAQSDVVIVLVNLKQSNNVSFLRSLAQSGFDQIDLVIDGIYDDVTGKPRRFGELRMVSANSRGKYVGEATITLTDGQVTDVVNEVHPLDVALPEDPEVAARVAAFHASEAAVAGGK